MNRDEAITELCQFLEEQGGEVEEITPKKLWDRAEIIEDPEYPNCIVFTLERHRSIMGSFYKPGHPMAAFVTYWPLYAFDRQTRKLDQIGEAKPDKVHIDYDHLAREDCGLDFELSPVGDGRWRYHESCYCEEGIVSSQEELEDAASNIVDRLDLTVYIDILSEHCGGGEAAEHARKLAAAYEERAREQARRDWEYAQEESEPG